MDKKEVAKVITEIGEKLINILPENWHIFINNNIDEIYRKATEAARQDNTNTGLTSSKVKALSVVVLHDFLVHMSMDIKGRLKIAADLDKHRN